MSLPSNTAIEANPSSWRLEQIGNQYLLATHDLRAEPIQAMQVLVEMAYKKVVSYTRTQTLPDPMGIALFDLARDENLALIRRELEEGRHDFEPLQPLFMPKRNGSNRFQALGSMFDRVVVQAAFGHAGRAIQKQVIEAPYRGRAPLTRSAYAFLSLFYPHVYAWWVMDLRAWHRTTWMMHRQDRTWCLCLDLKGYFHAIDRARLQELLRPHVPEPNLLRIVSQYMNYRFFQDNRPWPLRGGIPIDEPLSRLFGNLYLAEFDRLVLDELKVPYIRYMDDMRFFVTSEKEARNLQAQVEQILAVRFNLFVNADKARVCKTC